MIIFVTIYILGFLIAGAIINHTGILSDRLTKDDRLVMAMVLGLGSWFTLIGLFMKHYNHNHRHPVIKK